MDEKPNLCSIPPELFYQILSYLDEKPRCFDECFVQPTLNVISSRYKHPPLKTLSRVSRGFRRLLFRELFLYTIQLVTAEDRDEERNQDGPSYPEWPGSKFYSFLNFIEEKELHFVVSSFTLAIKAQHEFDSREFYCSERFGQTAEYNSRWMHLLLRAAPRIGRVTIIAPPPILGVLTAVYVHPSVIEKLHIPYQILSLWREEIPFKEKLVEAIDTKDVSETCALFTLYKWSGIILNEGSFLRSYHTPTSWQDKLFMSDHFLQISRIHGMFDGIREFCYIGLWAPEEHLKHVVRFAGSLPNLEVFQFGLQTANPLLDDPDRPLDQRRFTSALWSSYHTLMYICTKEEEVAEYLRVNSCFNRLYLIQCMDHPDAVDLTDSDPAEGWHWFRNNSDTHTLERNFHQ